jgi:hypothetical protein
MQREQTTVIVSVNVELDEEARFEAVERQVGQGWRVLSAIPLSGGGLGPGGESESFLRMQVHLERLIDEDGVIVDGAGRARSGDAAAGNAADAPADDRAAPAGPGISAAGSDAPTVGPDHRPADG